MAPNSAKFSGAIYRGQIGTVFAFSTEISVQHAEYNNARLKTFSNHRMYVHI